jgi:D-glycero-D-manno-heptose 1,7-bisphosphate phosphatase
VLFDRDGTLVEDVPYNGRPDRVRPMAGAKEALDRLRSHGLRLGVITNQSGLAHGLLQPFEVTRVNRRVDDLLGPFDVWAVCPHAPDDGCGCRKPRPGLVRDAARRLGVESRACVVVGDIGSDVDAAIAARAGSVLVPTPQTLDTEIAAAPCVASSLHDAVGLILEETAR